MFFRYFLITGKFNIEFMFKKKSPELEAAEFEGFISRKVKRIQLVRFHECCLKIHTTVMSVTCLQF